MEVEPGRWAVEDFGGTMNTSEVLDLSKENIQPLKQGRNPVKLGTALQAQTNVELHQKLLAEREKFELLIRMYEGEDPLKPHYDYVHWIEQSFPKHGPESNIIQILENTLTTFKDDERYKQDLRYAELLIKYIDIQPNPIEIYQLVYNQGLCTMCAPFYIAWADELDKVDDFKNADQIYELGIKVKAEPIELLQDAHLRFQLSVGRRMLGHPEVSPENNTDFTRQALHKLQRQNVHSVRDPVAAPGRIKQALPNHNNKNPAPFKIYQGEDAENNVCGEGKGKAFPKEYVVNKENQLKPGPWSQNKGKHRSRGPISTAHMPTFQIHQDEEADNGNQCKVTSVPRALKPRKIDNFTCPLAVFEPPDPTKKPMYCKQKVYAGGREFQFEELRAAIYNRRYEQLQAMKIKQEAEVEINFVMPTKKEDSLSASNIGDQSIKGDPQNNGGSDSLHVEVVARKMSFQQLPQAPRTPQVELKSASDTEPTTSEKNPPCVQTQSSEKPGKMTSLEGNVSLFNCQSFTVNTKEAMNVVQEMWNSPSPSPAVGKQILQSSHVLPLDESRVFKVPPAPAPLNKMVLPDTPPVMSAKPVVNKTPSFQIFSDDENNLSLSNHPFQIYSDGENSKEPNFKSDKSTKISSENISNDNHKEIALSINPFHHKVQPRTMPQYETDAGQPLRDPATMKMLAFQSDSEDSSEDQPKPSINTVDSNKVHNPLLSSCVPVTVPISHGESSKKSFTPALHPALNEEEGDDDMTCNTKAFEFILPSSTPLVSYLKTPSSQADKNFINGSYVAEEAKKCPTKNELSMIFEASKERYSSSSGSSGSKTQGSVCTAANSSAQPPQAELIEKLAQISANKTEDELERSLEFLNISGPVDPFSTDLNSRLLSYISYPQKHHLIGLHRFQADAPPIHCNSTIKLGNTKYSVIGELGKGNYARVLKATRDSGPVALKQQKPAWEWEWYIVQELQSRLPGNMMARYLHMSNGYIYNNGSILESEWAQYGSILSVINKLKIAGKGHDIHLSLLFSIQLISIVEHLHKCEIIHGDIKPDNFVLGSLPKADLKEPCLKLIDFGRSIDMTLFPKGTTFNVIVTTDGFQCNEMKEGRPWTYQTDLYGLAGSIHCVLFYDYMKVVKKDKKIWQLSNKVPRYMAPDLWLEIFHPLLNVESCENLPDLAMLREKLEARYKTFDISTINQSINKLTNVLANK